MLMRGGSLIFIVICEVVGETSTCARKVLASETNETGKALEVSPEEVASDRSFSRSTSSFSAVARRKIYEAVALWESTTSLRQTGKIFDSTKGYPGEGPSRLHGGQKRQCPGHPRIS